MKRILSRSLCIIALSLQDFIFVKQDSEKDSTDVFDTIDLIMDMDDVKDELRALLVRRDGKIPEKRPWSQSSNWEQILRIW